MSNPTDNSLMDELAASHSLAAVMQEVGYTCTMDEASFASIARMCPRPTEASVAEVLSMMAQTPTGNSDHLGIHAAFAITIDGAPPPPSSSIATNTWNVRAVVNVMKSIAPDLSWSKVVEALDHDKFFISDQPGFLIIITAYRHATPEPFPLHAVLNRVWRNTAGQISFLRFATLAPPETFTFEHSARKIPPLDSLPNNKSPLGTPNHAWLSLDLVETLCALANFPSNLPAVRTLLETPLKLCPEVLVVAFSSIPTTPTPSLAREITSHLAPLYLANNPASSPVLHRLWSTPASRPTLTHLLVDYYTQEPTNISRILDICQDLRALNQLLDSSPYPFALELAALASRSEFLNIDKFLSNRLSTEGTPFLTNCLRFLDLKLSSLDPSALPLAPASPPPGKIIIPVDIFAAFLRLLNINHTALDASELQRVKDAAYQRYPALAAMLAHTNPAVTFSDDVETEVNDIFQRMYSDTRPTQDAVADVLTMLKRYQASPKPHEQQVFACMIHYVMDEAKFYQNYPDKQLHTTALLFGGLIQSSLISSITLGIALRYIADSLNHPPSSKLFSFGTQALRAFHAQLALWPNFCKTVLAIPHAASIPQDTRALLEQAAAAADPTSTITPEDAIGASTVATSATPASTTSGPAQRQHFAAAAAGPTPAAVPSASPPPSSSTPAPPTSTSTGLPMGYSPSAGGSAVSHIPAAVVEAFNAARPTAPPAAVLAAAPPSNGAPAALQHPTQPAAPPPVSYNSQGSFGYPTSDLLTKSGTNLATQVAAATLSATPGLVNTCNAESLGETAAAYAKSFVEPSEKARDRIAFLMNNLAMTNLEKVAKELKELLIPKYTDWFSNYLTVKRAAQEPNFHALYMALVAAFDHRELYRALVKATHHYVRYMLAGDRVKSNSNDRSVLKYLASWLGLLTFSRDKAILAKDLDVKALILDGYRNGKMFPVLIVVGKLLECCIQSKVFRPPNPYTMSILALTAEVYRLESLKLNLKFEIERMFRLFPSLDLNTIRPTACLTNLPRDTSPSNPDFQNVIPQQVPTIPEAGPAPTKPQPTPPAPPSRPSPPAPPTSGHIPPPPAPSPSPRLASQDSSQAALTPPPPSAEAPSPATEPSAPYTALLANIASTIVIGPQLAPFSERLQLRKNVQAALERAVLEIIAPVVERSVMIACMTTYELILKDFALEPEEARMSKAAHLMASSLAGSLAIVTGKEPLRVSLSNHLRALLMPLPPGDANLVDQAVAILVTDNIEQGCFVIEQAASEKARGDIDKSLAPAYEARRKSKALNQPFYPEAYQQRAGFPAGLPESLKPKPGQQSRVYEDFTRIPRTAPPTGPGALSPTGGPPRNYPPGMGPPQLEAEGSKGPDPLLTNEQVLQKFVQWQQRVDAGVAALPKDGNGILPEAASLDIQIQLQELTDAVNSSLAPEEIAIKFARRVFTHLFDVPSKPHVSAFVAAIVALFTRTPAKSIPSDLTGMFVSVDDARKYSPMIAEALVRGGVLLLSEVDVPLSKVLLTPAAPSHTAAAEFSLHMVRSCIVDAQVVPPTDLFHTLDVLGRLSMRGGGGADSVMQLVEKAYAAGGGGGKPPLSMAVPAYMRVAQDPQGMKDAVVQLFDDWARTLTQKVEGGSAGATQAALANSLLGLKLLELDDRSDRFLRMLVDFAVAHCINNEQIPAGGRAGSGQLNFIAIDTLTKLLVALATPQPAAHGNFGEPYLARILHVLVNAVKRDADSQLSAFNARPYLRLFVGLLCELSPADPADPAGFRNLKLLASALFSLQPSGYPGFAFAWLELVSHRSFMPKLLLAPGQQGWKLFEALLIALLRFMEPFLRNADIPDTVRQLYKGTLRVLLVLLHDFPEFLCEHHFQLCDAIPFTCIQMRNLILSAFPHNMRLPDPFTPNLKVDLLPEIQTRPRIFPDPDTLLPDPLRAALHSYLKARSPPSFPLELSKRLLLPAPEAAAAGTPYNVPLINALVLNLGAQSKPGVNPASNSSAMDIFHHLVANLDTEGRYLFLNALANQLRYPNAYTHYFSCVLLCLFSEAKAVDHKEQITRVLLERLVVNRPHPWGLLITFIELIKNPRYAFWSHPFTRCAPEIERLFESVARSCIGSAAPKHEEEMPLQAEPSRA